MIINHNIAALNTHRQMGSAQSAQMNNMEKLSSGLRINSAKDDAAGLTISEKMRGQIRGLEQGSRNAQDGISLIQTAEGALSETQDILQRMRELAVQAANDTNAGSDRRVLQEEMGQLVKEIDRISTSTEFNTQKLVDGSFKSSFQIGANENQKLDLTINAINSSSLGLAAGVEVETGVAATGTAKLTEGIYSIKGSDLVDAAGQKVAALTGGTTLTTAGGSTYTFGAIDVGDTVTIGKDGKASLTKDLDTGKTNTNLAGGTYTISNSGTDVLKDGEKIGTYAAATSVITFTDTSKGSIDLNDTFGMVAPVADGTFTVKAVDVSSHEQAAATITAINTAIESVSSERSKLGATQNRLDHTINNLNTSAENLTAAESRIRDVDYAEAA
ncbi:flagellin [Planococcus halocryophilus]|uniref:flagellin N-terminal helical domain-containing protein n=1 Tax=Planococcus halocryophilus TaxID=1215089 RepID=UPI0023EA74F2|nr:flagellin [Planococcus halocryophilus]